MKNLTMETIKKRELERSYLIVYSVEATIKLEEGVNYINERKVYMFFGMTLEGKRQYLTSILEKEQIKTSTWYDMFQDLKKRKVEHIIFGLLPDKKELREAIKLSFPEIEIFDGCDVTLERLKRYNSYKTRDELTNEVKKLYVAKDITAYEVNYKVFKEKYEKYPFIMELLGEKLEKLRKNYKYSYELRTVVYAFNYMVELNRRLERITNIKEYKNQDEFIKDLLYYITNTERAVVYPKYKWIEIINEIYEEKKEYIKPYI